MLQYLKTIRAKTKSLFQKITPGKVAWKGANKAIATTAIISWIAGSLAFFVFASGKSLFGIVPVIIGLGIAFLISAACVVALWFLKKIPKGFFWVLPGAIFLTIVIFGDQMGAKFSALAILCSGITGAGLFTLMAKHELKTTILQKTIASIGLIIGSTGLIWGLVWLFDTGQQPEFEPINAAELSVYRPDRIQMQNPAILGKYEVKTLTYGSGKDLNRTEFAEGVTIVTDSVDGSRLIDNWEGLAGKLRTKFWGFDETALPINGRVWFPEGNGPYPLALIVHGNHGMEDFSDIGYAYLGELLASHGIITVSVDQNFINSSWKDMFGDGLDEENDARGWLLLEHLKYWRKWNNDPEELFYKKVDLDNIAVMGHSRGGEAAAVAAFLNTLKYYPDDAKQIFDFNFNIKSVVAIAPVDGQYKPGEIETPLEDLNYLVIHGANDGDVSSFGGLRQYERVKFNDSTNFFKSAIYVNGANHGQFNTSWGDSDSPQPFATLLNKAALLPMEDQLEIGRVYISAFLQATLQGKKEYIELFKDYRVGLDWLPKTIYLNQYQSSNWIPIADFEEDLDLTTTSSGGSIATENLSVWREQLVSMKWGNRGTRAVHVGWDSLAYEGKTPSIEFILNQDIDLTGIAGFAFELSEAKEDTYPDSDRDKEDNSNLDNQNTDNSEAEVAENKDEDEAIQEKPIDFKIELSDTEGNYLTLLLSEYSFLQRQLAVDILKNPELDNDDKSEAVYSTFIIGKHLPSIKASQVNLEKLKSIKFIFDQTSAGVIIIDRISAYIH